MTPLVLVTGALLLVSGTVKIRAARRSGVGIPLLAVLELLFSLASGMLAVAGSAGASVAAWFVPAGVVLVVGSSAGFVMRLRAHRRHQAETEGGRLATYVKYLSKD